MKIRMIIPITGNNFLNFILTNTNCFLHLSTFFIIEILKIGNLIIYFKLVILLNKTKCINNIKKIDEPIAFVLGRYVTGGLGAVRCLGREKIPVVWLDSDPKQYGFYSKYCNGIFCPDSKSDQKDYINCLIDIGTNLKHKGVLFPVRDIEVYTILKHRSQLEKSFHLPMANIDITEKLLNKSLFYKTLEKLGYAHAKTFFPENLSDVEQISKKIVYPCILKPYYSADFALDFKIKLFKADSQDQLIQFYKKANSRNHKVIIQEIIPGNAKCMHGFNAYFDKDNNPNGSFMYRRIREWPHEMGNGCFIESVNIPEIEEIVTSLIKKMKYYGIVDAEIRKDPRDNEFKLIEINPRCWMQSGLPAKCGANLPHIAYLDSIGEKFEKPDKIKQNVKWLFISEDIRSSIKSILNNELSILEWIRSYRGEKEYSIFAIDDPVPFFLSLIPFYFR